MSEDFRKLMKEIEAEAQAEGPAAETELRELRCEFATLLGTLQVHVPRCE